MAKRYTDTEKWRDSWFRRLTPTHKCLWIYFLDICDHAGIMEIDKELAEFSVGTRIDWEDVFKVFKGRIIDIKNDKYFIQKFIDFQYGTLDDKNRVHQSAINLLKKHGLYKTLIRGIDEAKDKDKDKDIYKDIDLQYYLDTFNKLVDHCNNQLKSNLSRVAALSDSRKSKLRKRDFKKEYWEKALKMVPGSKFLMGQQENNSFKITFDWLITNDNNIIKVLEGNYND